MLKRVPAVDASSPASISETWRATGSLAMIFTGLMMNAIPTALFDRQAGGPLRLSVYGAKASRASG